MSARAWADPDSAPSPAVLASPAARWLAVAFCALVPLSGLQLYLQDVAGFDFLILARIFTANLVACTPWIPLAAGVIAVVNRRPLRGGRRLLLHLALSGAACAAFLGWLSLFHMAIAPLIMGAQAEGTYLAWLRRDVEEFLTLALLIHWAVVAVAHAARSRLEAADEPGAAKGVEPPPLVIRSLGRSRVIRPSDVCWIEAEGSYVRLHTEDGSHLLRRSLADLAAELAGEGFVRIHRSTVVRLDRIAEVRRRSHGDASVVLKSGTELKVSRTYRGALSSLGL